MTVLSAAFHRDPYGVVLKTNYPLLFTKISNFSLNFLRFVLTRAFRINVLFTTKVIKEFDKCLL